jgi:hypothetical protein
VHVCMRVRACMHMLVLVHACVCVCVCEQTERSFCDCVIYFYNK